MEVKTFKLENSQLFVEKGGQAVLGLEGPGLAALTAAFGLRGLGGRAQLVALDWFKIYLNCFFDC